MVEKKPSCCVSKGPQQSIAAQVECRKPGAKRSNAISGNSAARICPGYYDIEVGAGLKKR
jgi:hypothetical protein